MKTVKRVCMVMLAMILLMSSFVMAADERIKFGEVSVSSEEGVTTLSVELLTKPAGKSTALVAAYVHPDTGRLLSVNYSICADVSLLESDSLKVILTDKTDDGGVLSYDIWDSIENGVSLLNSSPSVPDDLMATAGLSDADISWSAPLDDFDLAENIKYNIYDEGMLIKENCTGLEFAAENLVWGSEYNFEVRAVDSEGAESESAEVKVNTIIKNTVLTTSEYTQSPEGNLEFTGSETETTRNFYSVKAQAGGLDCYSTTLTTSANPTGSYLTYRFADDYYAEVDGIEGFVCELTYFDEGEDNIKLEYHYFKEDGSQGDSSSTFLKKTNTKTWKTARKIYTLAAGRSFKANDNYGNGYFTFRLKTDNDNVGLKARSFSVFPIYDMDGETDEYFAKIKNNAGAYFKVEGASVTCDLESNAEGRIIETVADRDCVKLSALPGNSFEFEITDSALQSENVEVIISYYAENEKTQISLGDVTQPVTANGKWQKMCFKLSDLGSGINYITANKDLYINSVRVISAE